MENNNISKYKKIIDSDFSPRSNIWIFDYLFAGTIIHKIDNSFFYTINTFIKDIKNLDKSSINSLVWLLIYLIDRRNINHTCVSIDEITNYKKFNNEEIVKWINDIELFPEFELNLINTNVLHSILDKHKIIGTKIQNNIIVYQNNKWQFSIFNYLENQIKDIILHKSKLNSILTIESIQSTNLLEVINILFNKDHIDTIDMQQISVLASVGEKISFIFGGPGTGKTTTVKKLIILNILVFYSIYKKIPNIALSAPTGKASKKLSSSIINNIDNLIYSIPYFNYKDQLIRELSKPALTIHSLLEINTFNPKGNFNTNKTLPYDIIVIDECSMIDLPLMHNLMSCINDDTIVIFLGDKNQLPPVGYGTLIPSLYVQKYMYNNASCYSKKKIDKLKLLNLDISTLYNEESDDLSDQIHVLNFSRRYSKDSNIYKIAELINNGESHIHIINKLEVDKITIPNSINKFNDVQINIYDKKYNNSLEIQNIIVKLAELAYEDYIDAVYSKKSIKECFDKFNKVRFLCPQRKGLTGVEQLNDKLQHRIRNKFYNEINEYDLTYPPSTPIMITKNDPINNLSNGDIGLILYDDRSNKYKLFFNISNEYTELFFESISYYELSFFITVHKSQGDEYDNCYIVLPELITDFHSRSLIYTAITRSKYNLIILAPSQIKNIQYFFDESRNSMLGYKWNNNKT